MTKDNFAILITPCIFRHVKNDPFKELSDTPHLVKVSKIMINNYEKIFKNNVQNVMSQILESSE